jgi:ComF family protein
VCWACGERLLSPDAGEQRLCLECTRLTPPFRRAVAYGSYEGGLRDLIHLLKYERMRSAAPVLGRMLAEAVSVLLPEFGPAVLVLPVPLHESKQRQRGFNQSELIARAMLKQVAGVRLGIETTLLVRRRATDSQIGLSRAQRHANLRGAFSITRSDAVAGRDILLVDDVFTTGTTVTECARVLRRAGAGEVWVATVARVLRQATASVSLSRRDWEVEATHAGEPRARAAQA